MLIAIDNGYWSTKLYNGNTKFFIPSRVEEEEEITKGSGRYAVEYRGKNYLVGEAIESYELTTDKTNSLFHKILTLTALGKITDITATYNVVAGLPINMFNKQKEKFAEYLRTQGKEKLTINGEEKYIEIKNVKVFPQAAGVLYSLGAENYKNKKVGIIDIGGYTTDACIFNNLNLVNDSIFTEDFGTHRLYSELAREINAEYGLNIKEDSVPQIIRDGLVLKGVSISINKELNKCLHNIVKTIVRNIRTHSWELDTMPVIITGGGSLIKGIKDVIRDYVPDPHFSQDPVFDNVKGFYTVGEVIFTK